MLAMPHKPALYLPFHLFTNAENNFEIRDSEPVALALSTFKVARALMHHTAPYAQATLPSPSPAQS